MKCAIISDISKNNVKNYLLGLFLVVLSFRWTDRETMKVKQTYEELM